MDKPNFSFEPMDVDLSVHSNNDMDISNEQREEIEEISAFISKMNESIKSTPIQAREDVLKSSSVSSSHVHAIKNIRKFAYMLPPETVSHRNATKSKVTCIVLVLLLSVLAYQLFNVQCCDDINSVKLKQSLSDKLYGQTMAIDSLIDGLANNKSKVLIVYGSTGVGKTFAASLLLEHLGSYSNVYHYTMPSFMETFTTDFMLGLTVCMNTFIVVDDLSPNDLNVRIHIDNLITKSENLNKVVTVLLIYNHCNTAKDFKTLCDDTFPARVMDNLKHIKAFKKLIRFETLTEEHLLKCMKTELGHRKFTDSQLNKMLKNFDVTIDGCKGVHTKMKLLDLS